MAVTSQRKPIVLSEHAAMRLGARGCTEAEIADAIQTMPWSTAELKRLECRKVFPFSRSWNGRFYALKEVRPIFVEEAKQIVVVTVYTYFR